MITFIRWILLKSKKIKWELALWQFLDKQLAELTRNPEELEKKVMAYIAEEIHSSHRKER